MLQENHNYQITKNRRFCTKKYKLIWLGKNTWSTHSQRWVPQLPINSWSWNHCGKSSRGIISIIIRGQRRENDWWEVLDMGKRINKNHYNPTIQIQYISILNITFNSHHCPWGFDNTRKKTWDQGVDGRTVDWGCTEYTTRHLPMEVWQLLAIHVQAALGDAQPVCRFLNFCLHTSSSG